MSVSLPTSIGSSACPAPGAGPSAACPSSEGALVSVACGVVSDVVFGAGEPSAAGAPWGAPAFADGAEAVEGAGEDGAAGASAVPACPAAGFPVESHIAAGGEVKTSVALPSVADMPPSAVSSTLSPDDLTAYWIRPSAGLSAASGVLTIRTWRKPSVVAVILRSTSGSTFWYVAFGRQAPARAGFPASPARGSGRPGSS